MSEPSPVNETASTQPLANPQQTASSADAQTVGHAVSGGVGDDLDFLGKPATADEVGRLAHYRVLKELGRGGMGCVLLAEDTKLQRRVALKVMLPRFAQDATAKERFLREARAAGKIKHDHVISIYQVDEDRGVPFIALEFLEGAPLDRYLKNKGVLPLPVALRIAKEIAAGLEAAHKEGLVHRDIKPGNIWLEAPKGRVKILDFGLARAEEEDTHLTQSGAIVGTPSFMAPEQARGEKVDGRCDLFSLGVVLYRLTTGQQPFAGRSTMAVLTAIAIDNPAPARSLNAQIPESLEGIITKLLEKDPDRRYETAKKVIADLSAVQKELAQRGKMQGSSVSVEAARPTVTKRLRKGKASGSRADDGRATAPGATARKRRLLWVGAVLGILGALLAAGIIHYWPSSNSVVRPKDEPNPIASEADKAVIKPKQTPNQQVRKADFTNSLGMEFVLVPRGTGWLGGGAGKPGEQKVDFDYDFYLGRYEVTQEEWEKVTGQLPSTFSRTNPAVKDISDADLKRFPVETVFRVECDSFINILNEKEKDAGWVYRLPTEAEWEYACRGGPVDRDESAFDYYFAIPSNELLAGQANYRPAGPKQTCKVGSFEPNILGLYDMHGNVWEWCDDKKEGPMQRVRRGGAWDSGVDACRAADRRERSPPRSSGGILGLRLARVPADMTNIEPQ